MALFSFRHSVKTYSNKRRRGQRLAKRGQTISHIRYITRDSAAREVLRGGVDSKDSKDSKVAKQAEKDAYKRKGRVAERFTIALPVEATNERRTALARRFSDTLTSGGAGYIAAIHDKKGNDIRNPHFHLIAFDAHISSGGRGRPRSVLGFARSGAVENAAERWALIHNKMMAEWGYGQTSMITHLSYSDRGIERIPTIHEGPAGFRKPETSPKTTKARWSRVDSGHTRKEANKLITSINRLKEEEKDGRANRLGGSIQANRGLRTKERGSGQEALGSRLRNQRKTTPPFCSSSGTSSKLEPAAKVKRRSPQRDRRATLGHPSDSPPVKTPWKRKRRLRRVYAELKFYHDSLMASSSELVDEGGSSAALRGDATHESEKYSRHNRPGYCRDK